MSQLVSTVLLALFAKHKMDAPEKSKKVGRRTLPGLGGVTSPGSEKYDDDVDDGAGLRWFASM